MTSRCICCAAEEPAGGWYSFFISNGELVETYCSPNCFIAHQEGACGCFIEDEFTLPLGDEEWDA